MKAFRISIAFLLSSFFVKAQVLNLDWEAQPVAHKVDELFKKESAVIIADKRLHEYAKDDKKGVVLLTTCRRIIKVNDDKGVEMYNKIYIPVYDGVEILQMKARTIQPNGQVVNLPDSKIVEETEKGLRYKKFALEGVEKGSEIEYYYKLKDNTSFFGMERFSSASTPCQEAEFTLITPDFLSFTVKGYNGIHVSADTIINERRIVTATSKNTPALEEEKYATREAFIQNVQYKFSYNLNKDKNVRLYTWDELAKNVYNNYTTFSDKETKAMEGFLKQTKIDASASEEQKIIALEDYIKTNINIDKEGIGDDADKIVRIVKTKVATSNSVQQLFIGCMEKLGINWQIVFPSKRDELPLDESLENYRLIDDLVFYFPSTGQFLEPANAGVRYPYIQANWAATRGLFLKGTTIGSFKTAVATFDTIPIQTYDKASHNMEVRLKFDEGMDSLLLHSTQMLTGYGALSYRPIFNVLSKDKKDEFTREIIKSVAKSESIKNIKVANEATSNTFLNKPLTIEADIASADLFEMAGNKILVKLGEVIGPQEQMYQEKPRQLPISFPYPHVLDRDIYFTIPDGYQIKNLGDLNINIVVKKDNEEAIGFISGFAINNNELVVKVHEFYKATDFPLSMFEEFKKVINASADFNKIVLVLEKKNK